MGVEVIKDEKDQIQENPFEVTGKQPGFVYRGLNKNARNIGRKIARGYQIVQGNDPEKFVASDSTPMKAGQNVDTTQNIADIILARIPEEKYKEGVIINRKKIDRLNAMIIRDYDRDVGKIGFNPKRDPTGNSTKYSTGVTESGWDKQNMSDKEFETKYGMSKSDVEE